jgi:hypothetical protein
VKEASFPVVNKRAIKQFLRESYHFAGVFHDFRLRLATSRGKEPILIFQMGKVGSTSVMASLKALKLGRPIYHIHTLTEDGIAHGESIYGKMPQSYRSRGKHLLMSQLLRKHLAKGLTEPKWKIITPIREPIGRNVSSFFQIIDVLIPDFEERYGAGSIKMAELTDLFLEQYPVSRFLDWFDVELKSVFGVDVFSSAFPTTKGYKIYGGPQADVLLLRLENINECANEAFTEFLNVEQFKLVKANVASEKKYYEAYQQFAASVILPDTYLNQVYASKYAQHFYSAEEINAFKVKWNKNGGR